MHIAYAAVLMLVSQWVSGGSVDMDARRMLTLRQHVQAVAEDNTIIISQSLCTYLEFAENWIFHVERLGIHNYLIIAEDEATLEHMNKHHPRHAVPSTLFGYSPQDMRPTFKEYGDPDFASLSCRRPTLMSVILRLGYSVLWTDMDTVWTESPFPLIPRHYDFVGVQEGCLNGCSVQDMTVCTCLMHMQPTKAMFRYLDDWHESCANSTALDTLNDQDHFNEVFKASGASYLQYYILPCQLYPSGYTVDASVSFSGVVKPAWLHANFRVGKDSKRAFLKEHKLWNLRGSDMLPMCAK